jgi:hypothetical protein
MRLVEATLHVSEYTGNIITIIIIIIIDIINIIISITISLLLFADRMDVAKFIDKKNRTLQQLREICAILTGVLISLDYEEGQLLMDNREVIY